jgi:cell wall-associated protease
MNSKVQICNSHRFHMKQLLCLFIFFSFLITESFGQSIPQNWYLLDYKEDSYYGISLKKAYQFLQQKKLIAKPTIVAVLDSGVDTLHEDLKNILWHNPKEIPNNNIDDDNNGYVDDVFGWNFLGNAKGDNVARTSSEKARIFYKFKEKFKSDTINTNGFTTLEKEQFELWKKASKELKYSSDDEMELNLIQLTVKTIKRFDEVIKKEMGVNTYTTHQLEKFEPQTSVGKQSKYGYLTSFKLLEIDADETNTNTIAQLDEYIDIKKNELESRNTEPVNYRKNIINDDENNIKDKFYGNGNVLGPTPTHGTHVSGIIAAERNNKLGIDGVADQAKIMLVRVVPDGDEYDKDVALGIFYAVDNGAKVINMSFGKNYSPQKYWVDSALVYAEKKDVVVIHAAGNDATNIDSIESYPIPTLLNKTKLSNFITVGASSDFNISSSSLIANFSNYGVETVDVFAPGVKIYSTLPGGNHYGNQQGTSMAAPIVSGIAALLRSYFPSLTAQQIKNTIIKSVTKPTEISMGFSNRANNNQPLLMKDACASGGIVNAHKAVELAYELDQEIKKKIKK